MAVGSLPVALIADVKPEFAPNTLPANDHLEDYHDQVFGSGVKRLTDFANTGQPSGGSIESGLVSNNSIFISGEASNLGGLICSAYIEYADNFSFNSSQTTSTETNDGSTNNWGWNISGLNEGTQYYFRMYYWNPYNDNQADHKVTSPLIQSTSGDCNPPQNVSAGLIGGNSVSITWDDPQGGDPNNGYRLQYRVNNGSWNALSTPSSADESDVHDGYQSDYDAGDTVVYRIRAECSASSFSEYILSNEILVD